MKVVRRLTANHKKEILQLRDKNRNIISDRESLIHVVEEFYKTLYKSQITSEMTNPPPSRVQKLGSEDISTSRRNSPCSEKHEKQQRPRRG